MVLIVIKNYARTYFDRNETTRINDEDEEQELKNYLIKIIFCG